MLSLPHYSGSSFSWPTFVILSLEGLYVLQCRLTVIVYHTVQYVYCVFMCLLSKKETVCVCICDKETAGSIDSQGLWDLLPSPFTRAVTSLAVTFSKET